MKRLGFIAVFLLLSACQTPRAEPVVRTVEVKVPVAVACDPKVSAEPDWSEVEAGLRSNDIGEQLKAAYGGYKLARAYIAEQATGLKACAHNP